MWSVLCRIPVQTKRIIFYQTEKIILGNIRMLGFVEGEPKGPFIRKLYGPENQKLKEELAKIQYCGTLDFFVDLEKSIGNYLVDVDGNIFLDCYTQIASLPLGYNYAPLFEIFKSDYKMRMLINRTAIGVYPTAHWPDTLRNVLLNVAPPGLPNVTTQMCGTCANEQAFKNIFVWYGRKMRKGANFTKEEIESCKFNKPPGCPELAILSFWGAFHGRTTGSLSATRSKPIHRLGVPLFPYWPAAHFPRYKYPLDENKADNEAEDKKCLAEVEEIMEKQKKEGHPVAGVIVEPIQSEGGDNHASPEFFQQLQQICDKQGAALLIDEVQTGCGATGKMWCHEWFDLPKPPDIVTFSKKMHFGGYYHTVAMQPDLPYRIFNTWMGDPARIYILEEVINTIKYNDLLLSVKKVGEKVLEGMRALAKEFPHLIHSARGRGLMVSCNAKDEMLRGQILANLKKKGVLCGGCGVDSIRLRPSLLFQKQHSDIFLDRLRLVLKDLK